MIVVQKIKVVWTKASRGGEGARRRAAVPLAFELPAFPACGAPERDLVPPRWLMELRRGDYGRVLHNGRFSGEGDWSYQQIVFNVAIADVVASDLFMRAAPTVTADLRERLR
jgi:hypothetical protein